MAFDPGFASCALKLFLPSWNFFNDVSAAPGTEFRIRGSDGKESEWQPLYPRRTTRSLWRILYHPWGNLELLEQSQLARASDELTQLPRAADEFRQSRAYGILTRIARSQILRLDLGRDSTSAESFQFRLRLAVAATAGESWFLSERHPLAQPAQ